MDRTRFEHLLEAYGADFRRWPADERATGAAFATAHVEVAGALADAASLDRALDLARDTPDTRLLAARVLKTALQSRADAFDSRAWIALAACAVFGLIIGYGGGMLAPPAEEDDSYFAMAFEPPLPPPGDEG